jgi:hypothetical protein
MGDVPEAPPYCGKPGVDVRVGPRLDLARHDFDRLCSLSPIYQRRSKEGALTQDSPGSVEATKGAVQKCDIGEESGSTDCFGRRIDAASLATLEDLGMSETQIAHYRGLWCRKQQSAVVRAGARRAA